METDEESAKNAKNGLTGGFRAAIMQLTENLEIQKAKNNSSTPQPLNPKIPNQKRKSPKPNPHPPKSSKISKIPKSEETKAVQKARDAPPQKTAIPGG